MSNNNVDIFEKLNEHKEEIQNSCLFYRPVAKMQKIIVLTAATKYLAAEISKDQFLSVLDKNSHYADAFGVSKTKLLIEAALKEKPSRDRTHEGYIRIVSSSDCLQHKRLTRIIQAIF
jgi:hypothetical protein